jgi:putative cell wall-binding protein
VAAAAGGPILLTTPSSLAGATASELSRLKPQRIVVLGGTSAVSDGVLNSLRSYATSGSVTRIAGADRYATAAAISKASFAAGVPVAYVATGANFPDALAAGPVAAAAGGPILLTTPSSLAGATASELSRLKPGSVILLGGTGALSDAVRSQVDAIVN